MAGRDLNVAGSNVGAQKDLVLSGGRDVNIVAGENASDSYDYKMVKKSGFGALGGFSFGTRQQTDWVDGKKVFHTASTVGSVEGNVLINAGNGLNVVGSNVIARQGDVTLIGQQVNIVAALDTARSKEFHEIKQSGLSVTASNPVVSAVQTGERMASAASKVDNPVMQGLAAGTAGLAAYNAYDAVQKAGSITDATSIDKVGGVNIQISLGSSKSTSTTERNASSTAGSTIAAGKDLTIVAQGAGRDSDITVTGSNLSAGGNAVLKAEGDILLQAARNSFEQKTDSKSSSASIGVGYSTGGDQRLHIAAGGFRGPWQGGWQGRELDQQPCHRRQRAGDPVGRRHHLQGRVGQGGTDHRVGGWKPAAGELARQQQIRLEEQERRVWPDVVHPAILRGKFVDFR